MFGKAPGGAQRNPGAGRSLIFSVVFLLATAGLAESAPNPAVETAFEKHVRPVLVEHCWKCHGPKKQMAGLRLDSREAMLKGGDSGPVIKPGNPDASRLIQALRHEGELKMPPRKKLPAADIANLAAWIKAGAPWPAAGTVSEREAWKRHWAFQPVRRPIPPGADATGLAWARNPIDLFILAKQKAKGLSPSPQADRRTLIRRLSFDLLGLPADSPTGRCLSRRRPTWGLRTTC
jgi:hypothetical protein